MLHKALYMLNAIKVGNYTTVWLHFVRSLLVSRGYM